MKILLPCGPDGLELRLPKAAAARVRVIEPAAVSPLADPRGAVARALREPIGTPPLAELARGRRSACIVVSDNTRPVPNRDLLPPLLETLESSGIERQAIRILIATGMHRPNLGVELDQLVGADIASRYRILNHDCLDRAALCRVAEIGGASVEINRHYLEADLKILTGLIEPHPFAGYSGGGKSILPGLSSFETMKFMHSFALVEHPQVATARLAGNPFRQYIDEVSEAAGADFIVNAVIDKAKRPAGIFAGHVRLAHAAGCRQSEAASIVHLDWPADLVITTGGGLPLDATLYQATKGLLAAREILRPGGTIVLVAGCREGLGSRSYGDVVRSAGSPHGFRARYGNPENFAVDQWAAQIYFQVLERAGKMYLHSPHLTQEEIAPFGLTRIEDLAAALPGLCGNHRRICIVPEGPYVSCVLTASPGAPCRDIPYRSLP